jgi:ubiquinone biosynthesis protein COQ9
MDVNYTLKTALLQELVKIVPFSGWSDAALQQAATQAGYKPAYVQMLLLDGIDEMVDFFYLQQDAALQAAIQQLPLAKMRIRERISEAVWLRIQLNEPYKLLIKKTLPYLAMPWRWPLKQRVLWRCVDLIWHEAGHDKSVDYNYYTKRTLLAGVYSATLLYWLADNSVGYHETKAFLARRIENVMQIAKFMARK